MKTKEAAKLLGISSFYLRNLRHGLHPYAGPKCEPVSNDRGFMYWDYKEEDLRAWREEHPFRRVKLRRKTL
jgi:hypothetical protein